MKTGMYGKWLALALMGAATACGSQTAAHRIIDATPQARRPPQRLEVARPFFVPGEQMRWTVSLRGISGGLAVLAHGHPGEVDGREVIIVRSRVESVGLARVFKEVRDDVITWVETRSGKPVYYKADLLFGDRHASLESRFGEGSFVLDYERSGSRRRHLIQELPFGEHIHNAHSVLGMLRRWSPATGARAYFYALAGRRMWKNVVQLTARESIRTKLGRFPALRIDGTAWRYTARFTLDRRKKPRKFTIWISDDARHLPLLVTARTEYGVVRVELTDYEQPAANWPPRDND